MRGLGVLVVDLSADFRLLHLLTYEQYYGPHSAPELREGAVYGLPDINRTAIRTLSIYLYEVPPAEVHSYRWEFAELTLEGVGEKAVAFDTETYADGAFRATFDPFEHFLHVSRLWRGANCPLGAASAATGRLKSRPTVWAMSRSVARVMG